MTDDPQKPEPQGDIRVADATKMNWVDRYCPLWSRPLLRLSRADRPAGTWLLLLPCWWGLFLAMAADPGSIGLHDLWIFVACGIGAFLMRGAGCTWNDISDRDFDGEVARTKSRPLPAGQISVRAAILWMAIQGLLGLFVLLSLNAAAIVLGVLALVPVAIYPFAKRFTWWPQVFLGIAFNWGALLAWAAHSGSLGLAPVLLYLGGISWTLIYDTIYAHQDKEDDALIGVRSTARLFGDETLSWLRVFFVVAVVFLTFAAIQALIETASMPAMFTALFGVWIFGWHLAWQMRELDIDNPDICLRLFRANRDAGLLVALFFAVATIV